MKKISILFLTISLNLTAASSFNSSKSNRVEAQEFICPSNDQLEAIKANCLGARRVTIVKSKSNITNNRLGFACPSAEQLEKIAANCLAMAGSSMRGNLNSSRSNRSTVKSSKSNTND